MFLPHCIEGCPQHENTQQRGAYGPMTLLPHKTRVRHKKQAQCKRGVGRVQAHPESLGGVRGVQGGPGGLRGSRGGAGGVQGV